SDAELAMALARTHYEYAKLGERIWNERDLMAPDEESRAGLADMLTHAGKCTSWRAQAYNLAPENRAYARLLANATMGLGLAQLEQQQLDKQIAHFDEAEELIESSQAMREKLIAVKQDDGAVQA